VKSEIAIELLYLYHL